MHRREFRREDASVLSGHPYGLPRDTEHRRDLRVLNEAQEPVVGGLRHDLAGLSPIDARRCRNRLSLSIVDDSQTRAACGTSNLRVRHLAHEGDVLGREGEPGATH